MKYHENANAHTHTHIYKLTVALFWDDANKCFPIINNVGVCIFKHIYLLYLGIFTLNTFPELLLLSSMYELFIVPVICCQVIS